MRINLLQDFFLLSKRLAKGLLKYILIVAEVHHLELFKDLFEIWVSLIYLAPCW